MLGMLLNKSPTKNRYETSREALLWRARETTNSKPIQSSLPFSLSMPMSVFIIRDKQLTQLYNAYKNNISIQKQRMMKELLLHIGNRIILCFH